MRGLNATQISYIESREAVYEYLVEINYDGITDLSYTTGGSNVTVTTTTGGSQTFTPNNSLKLITDIVESYNLNASNVTLEFASSDATLLTNLTTTPLKTFVTIYLMFRNTTTNAADTSNIIQIFRGRIAEISVKGGQTENVITIQSSNLFNNFNNRNYVTTTMVKGFYMKGFYWGSVYVN
jgi:hypothetical protein